MYWWRRINSNGDRTGLIDQFYDCEQEEQKRFNVLARRQSVEIIRITPLCDLAVKFTCSQASQKGTHIVRPLADTTSW